MENIKQIKVNEELHDIEDAQARKDIALEITNRTNADDTLQEKINTNKTGIDNLVNDVAVRNVKAEEVTNVPEVKLPLDEVKEEIEAAGNRVLNSIPDDYTQMNNKISELKGDLTEVLNTGDIKSGYGFIWSATNDGAVWKDTKARLIADIEITESVSSIRIDNDMEGNQLRLKKVYFVFDKIVSNNINCNCYFESLSYNGNYTNISANSLIFPNMFNSSDSLLFAQLECLYENINGYSILEGFYKSYTTAKSVYFNRFYGGGFKAIQLRTSGKDSIGVGTKLKIYGIDY